MPELHRPAAPRRRLVRRRRQPLRRRRCSTRSTTARWSCRRRSARSTTATLARNAIDYAYRHGVTVIASAADEAAQHHNWPASYPHVIVVNSVTKYDDRSSARSPAATCSSTAARTSRRKVTVAMPVGQVLVGRRPGAARASAGLIYSAALDAHDHGALDDNAAAAASTAAVRRQPNEVRQLMASGTFQGAADDVDFADAERLRSARRRTAPTRNLNAARPPRSTSRRWPTPSPTRPAGATTSSTARGRLNANRAVHDAATGASRPRSSIESPDWWAQVDPANPTIDLRGRVAAQRAAGATRARCYVAPGVDPNNGSDVSAGGYGDSSAPGDFHAVGGGLCDGTTVAPRRQRGQSAARLGRLGPAAERVPGDGRADDVHRPRARRRGADR